MRIIVDQDRCCAIGNCTMTAPEIFEQDDSTGAVVLLEPDPPAELHELVRRAAGVCPCEAIRVEEG